MRRPSRARRLRAVRSTKAAALLLAVVAAALLAVLAAALVACQSERPRAAPPQHASPGWQPAPPPATASCVDSPAVCSHDRASIVQCRGGSWVVLGPCMGPQGCVASQGTLACDTSISPIGAPCGGEGSFSCTPDRAAMAVCRGGRAALASTCRGPRACSVGQAVACDTSLAAPGDACDTNGKLACGTDRRTMLRCAGGAFTPAETCRNACLAASGRVLCQ